MRHFALLVPLAALALAGCDKAQTPTPSDAVEAGLPSEATLPASPVPGSTAPTTPNPTPSDTMSGTPTPSPTTRPPSACGAGKASKFVGKTATPDVRAQVIEAVGHNRIRWIGPDTVVTMDFSESRLNADLTAASRITGFRCG